MKKIITTILALVLAAGTLSAGTAFAGDISPKDSAPAPTAVPSSSVYIGEAQEEPEDVNPLTGEAGYNTDAIGKRPVAVMINNHPDNYPQYNIGKADVIFEVVVEHDLTRMLAMFADYTDVPYLVSIRSYRYYFPAISNGFDAFYIHWGEDTTMMEYYYELNLDSYDGISNTYLFGRDQDRLNRGYGLEHTSCLYGDRLPDQINADGKRTDLKEEYLGDAFNFVPYGTYRIPDEGSCNFVDIQYGQQSTQITYDAENEKYLKFANNEPQIDGITGEQLEFDNVIILYTLINDRENDEANRKWLEVLAEPETEWAVGYYLSKGGIHTIRWAKKDESSRLKFYDTDWNEIDINRGKTYITFTYFESASLSDDIPEEYAVVR